MKKAGRVEYLGKAETEAAYNEDIITAQHKQSASRYWEACVGC